MSYYRSLEIIAKDVYGDKVVLLCDYLGWFRSINQTFSRPLIHMILSCLKLLDVLTRILTIRLGRDSLVFVQRGGVLVDDVPATFSLFLLVHFL